MTERVQHHCADVDHKVAYYAPVPAQSPPRSFSFNRLVVLSSLFAFLLLLFISSTMLLRKSAVPQESPILSPTQVPDGISPIPREAVRLMNGYAIIYPPDRREDGSMIVLDKDGSVIARHRIPASPPAVALPELHEVPIPWWYSNRWVLFSGGIFLAAIALLTWMMISRRKRADHTLSITMGYLGPLAHKT